MNEEESKNVEKKKEEIRENQRDKWKREIKWKIL